MSFAILALLLLFPFSSPAEDPTGSAVQPREELLCDDDITRMNAIESPQAVRILHLFALPDGKIPIDDEALKPIERFQEVRTLVLSCPKMTDNSLKHIAKLRHLECLIIYQCEITDSGIKDLKVLSKLQNVGLLETAVTEEGIAELKTTLDKTYFELGSFGKNGKIFDANGCMRPSYLKHHLKLPKVVPVQ